MIFLILRQPIKIEDLTESRKLLNQEKSEKEEDPQGFKEDIIATFRMLISKRMMLVLPLIIWSAVSQSIFSGCFVPMMNNTFGDDYNSNEKLEFSLLAMIPLGLGSVIGGFVQGFVADKFG